MNLDQKENIDNILAYILIKKIITPINKTDAFRLGLVNGAGRVVRKPETEQELMALTTLDIIIFKLKRLLGGKLASLNSFLYLSTVNNNMYDKLMVRGSVNQRADIEKIKRDIDKLSV